MIGFDPRIFAIETIVVKSLDFKVVLVENDDMHMEISHRKAKYNGSHSGCYCEV